jgi:hypothetical protein
LAAYKLIGNILQGFTCGDGTPTSSDMQKHAIMYRTEQIMHNTPASVASDSCAPINGIRRTWNYAEK